MNWLMNKISPELQNSFMKKVAIVGNAGTLKDSGLGEEIDSFDTVIRFSNSIQKGFEKDVGEKETCRFLCYPSSIDGTDFESTLENKKIFLMAGNLGRLLSAVVILANKNELYFLDSAFISQVNGTVNQSIPQAATQQTKMASLGLIATTIISGFFTVPTLYGFNHFSGDITNHHYYEEYKNKEWYPNKYHNFQEEKKIFDSLIENKLVIMK